MGLFLKVVSGCFWMVCALTMFYASTVTDPTVPHAQVVDALFIGMGFCGLALATLSVLYLGNDD